MELRVKPKTGKKYRDKPVIELDAFWYAKNAEKREGSGPDSQAEMDYVWGWAANIAVLVPTSRLDESEFPNIALGFTMSMPGTQHVAGETVDVLQSIVDRGHTPGAVVADRLYLATLTPETLNIPVKKMGWDVITDYKSTGLGIKGGKAGALQVEGRHYCAGTPKDLLNVWVAGDFPRLPAGGRWFNANARPRSLTWPFFGAANCPDRHRKRRMASEISEAIRFGRSSWNRINQFQEQPQWRVVPITRKPLSLLGTFSAHLGTSSVGAQKILRHHFGPRRRCGFIRNAGRSSPRCSPPIGDAHYMDPT